MRYIKVLLAGITVALVTVVLGIGMAVIKCVTSDIKINGSVLLSVALDVGLKEGAYVGVVVMILMLIGMRR